MRGLWVVAASTLLVACPGNTPDDPDGAPSGDGLTVRFTSGLVLPAMTAADRTIEDVTFQAELITAVGDGGSGERQDVELRWNGSNQPDPIRFDEAPPGIYSRVEVRLRGAGDDHAFEIKGEAFVAGAWQRYELESDELMTVTIPASTSLPPGGSATIEVPVDLASIIAGLDFTTCVLVDNELKCDGLEAAVAAAVAASFGEAVTVTE